MKLIKNRLEIIRIVKGLRSRGQTVGFVPTMGFLHDGHLSLVKKAKEQNDIVIVSIFVNPTQFGPNEDFEKYPRDLEHDQKLLEGIVDYLFVPSVDQVYLENETVGFKIADELVNCLCGVTRPEHFPGVALVLTKLFNIIRPNRAYFGQKDFQQTVVVKNLVSGLFFDLEVVVCPTVREKDGLAMSSRNVYLSLKERVQAKILYQSLMLAKDLFEAGEEKSEVIIQKMKQLILSQSLAKIDYINICDAETLFGVEKIEKRQVVVALAVNFGRTRLIDNILLP